jgi:uncharacterized membrane protein YozB (DUF420 family)
MLYIHPVWQTVTILLALYVLHLGWARFAFVHLGRKTGFNWKRHVFLGKAALYMWIYGALVGAAAAWVHWRRFGVTDDHFEIGVGIVFLALFGYWSGWRMDACKRKRKVLPLIHALCNTFLLILSFAAALTGSQVLLTLLPSLLMAG